MEPRTSARLGVIAVLVASLLVSVAQAADRKPPPKGLTYGGRVMTILASDIKADDEYEDRFEWRNSIDFKVQYNFAPGARFRVSGGFRYDLRVGDTVEAEAWANLGETWIQFRKKRFTLRAGSVVLSWGRNALLSPLNVLNPTDYGRALGGTADESPRIPVPGVRATLRLHPVTFEAVWLPFFVPTRVPFYGRDFAVFRPGMLEGLIQNSAPQTGAGVVDDQLDRLVDRLAEALVGLDPYARDGLQSYLAGGRPEELPTNGDIGLRVGFAGGGIDVDTYVFWHVMDTPQVRMHPALVGLLVDGRTLDSATITQLTNPDTEIVSSVHERALMGGLDVVASVGSFVVSGELAVRSKSVQYTRRLEPYTTPSLTYAVAARYQSGTTFAVDIEFQHDILLRARPDTLLRRVHDLRLAGVATLRLWRETFQLAVLGTWDILRADVYLHGRLTVVLDDVVRMHFGIQFFGGFRPDVAPSFDSLLSYRGGPIGYFKRNDYVYGTLIFTL
jgi:hypothetical protein